VRREPISARACAGAISERCCFYRFGDDMPIV
jgi:hypothetical protein